VHKQHRRQGANQWIEALVAVQVTADEPGDIPASTVTESRQILELATWQKTSNWDGFCSSVAAHLVLVSMREDNNVTRLHAHRRTISAFNPTIALDQHMKDRNTFCLRKDHRRQ
jgi:hypothetical protein